MRSQLGCSPMSCVWQYQHIAWSLSVAVDCACTLMLRTVRNWTLDLTTARASALVGCYSVQQTSVLQRTLGISINALFMAGEAD